MYTRNCFISQSYTTSTHKASSLVHQTSVHPPNPLSNHSITFRPNPLSMKPNNSPPTNLLSILQPYPPHPSLHPSHPHRSSSSTPFPALTTHPTQAGEQILFSHNIGQTLRNGLLLMSPNFRFFFAYGWLRKA